VLAAGVHKRYPREIESAAYFCCLEAVQNVVKHATGATVAMIELADNGVLRFQVRDDGAGFDERAVLPGRARRSPSGSRRRSGCRDGELGRDGRGTGSRP
jgi:signal transduction histidine kinase